MDNLWTLGPLDDIMPDIDNCHVLCFPCPNHHQPRTGAVLSHAYRRLVKETPALGGFILPCDDGSSRPGTKTLQASGSSLDLEVKNAADELGLTYQELKALGMPRRYLPPSLVMPSRATSASGARRTTAARATFIDGGCFLAFNTSHALMDGTSVINVMAAFAKHAADICVAAHDDEALPDANPDAKLTPRFCPTPSDLETLNPAVPLSKYDALKRNPRSWQMLGLDYRPKEESSTVLAAKLPPMNPVTRILSISNDGIRRLKDRCSAEAAANDPTQWMSTADSLAAILWSRIIRARTRNQERAGKDTLSTLMTAMDVRRLLKPPISSSYLGNGVLYARTESTTQDLSGSLSWGSVAQLVRASLQEHQKPEVMRETLELAASIPNVSALGLLYPTWLANDIVLSSIYGLGFYELNWGRSFGGQEIYLI
ncbi:hypothetical protein CSUB01_11658 [Colletotrichum sublineola]|uniref:Trichothecene 3-O-acetyltransferase n=1 Tax=Colletotrichum sublineola TaxID=1173701 RepID=A0A066XZA0_COLSU|nr:hypothetical protein CSUB01_11658 [Colletotrichum sublineola]